MRATIVCLTLFLVLAIACLGHAQFADRVSRRAATGEEKSIESGGRSRDYRLHVPADLDGEKAVPLLVLLHGGGGDADVASRMGMTPLADKHGFIVVYPEAIDRHWNDGRDSVRFRDHDRQVDDVAFIGELVDRLSRDFSIDRTRVFAAGASNGGFMSQRLAIERSDMFSAVGIMIATIAEPLAERFRPSNPVSVLFMNGTDDPFVPYDGGEVKVNLFPRLARFQRDQPSRGECISTDKAIDLWRRRNGLENRSPIVTKLVDQDPNDGCTIERSIWTDGEADTAVALFRIDGGGHTIPGGRQYLPGSVIGKTSGDIDAMETLWDFFSNHRRQPIDD